jgi:hypothetical protein
VVVAALPLRPGRHAENLLFVLLFRWIFERCKSVPIAARRAVCRTVWCVSSRACVYVRRVCVVFESSVVVGCVFVLRIEPLLSEQVLTRVRMCVSTVCAVIPTCGCRTYVVHTRRFLVSSGRYSSEPSKQFM